MLHSIKSGSFEPSFFLARFTIAIIEVEGPPKNILKEELKMRDFMMRRFEVQDTAEWFASEVNGRVIYDREFGFFIVIW